MMTKRMTSQPTANHTSTQAPALPTFADHLQELKGRFFWVAVYFMVASAAAYPFFGTIVHVLTAPLGDQRLYYMTPAGGLAFILKVCMYVGIVAILPVIIYHLYKFIAPVMKKNNARTVLGYTIASSLLAAAGIAFAYFVTLPAAIQFLTNINIDQISSMITIDSYMSFVIGYILAGALLFQLPLLMLMINSMTPLPPKKMMSYQRHIIAGSFVIAAIVSPTPDVVNQTILAAPMVVMYQIGIFVVWLRNRRRRPAERPVAAHPVTPPAASAGNDELTSLLADMAVPAAPTAVARPTGRHMADVVRTRPPAAISRPPATTAYHGRAIDGVVVQRPGAVARALAVSSRPVRPRDVSPSVSVSFAAARPNLRSGGLIPTI